MNIKKAIKITYIAISSLALFSIPFLLYAGLDQGVTLTYLRESYDKKVENSQVLSDLYLKCNISKKEIVKSLNELGLNSKVYSDSCNMTLNDLRFVFSKNNKLVEIDTDALTTIAKPCKE